MNQNITIHNGCNYVTLNNGIQMPVIGFLVYLIKGSDCVESVKNAIQVGYHHNDTSQFYGKEKEVGEGIKLSGIPKNQIFVITKVITNGYEATKENINQSI